MDIEKLMQDEELKAQIENAKSPAEVVEILKSKGIEITEEKLMKAMNEGKDGELGEDALENVAGGAFNWAAFWRGVFSVVGGPIRFI